MMIENFTAIVQNQDEGDQVELIVRRAVWAGVDGPLFTETVTGGLDSVDEILKADGLERAEAWRLSAGHAGMTLKAELIKI